MMMKRWIFQTISNSMVAVDTFFVLSGLLVCYLTLQAIEKVGGPRKFNWLLFYGHRYWRLTSPYMLVMMVQTFLFNRLGSGPLWASRMEEGACLEGWWRNLLYINNFFERKKSRCMALSWYLSVDMQCFIISPALLVPLFYSKVVGLAVSLSVVLANIIITAVLTVQNNFLAVEKLDSALNHGKGRFEILYVKPYTRVGAYAIGIVLGYVLYKTKCEVNMRKRWNVLGWTLSAISSFLIVYGTYTPDGLYHMTDAQSAFYNTTHRVVWALAVAWVIFACATGYGGPVNTLLSWSAVVPFSRISYCAFLVHPMVMKFYSNSSRIHRHWDDISFIYQFLGNLTLSMAAAFVVSLAFEAPMIGLENVLLAKYKTRRQS